MHITRHAEKRRQQRGVPTDILKVLQEFGSETHSWQAVSLTLDDDAIALASEDNRRLRARLEKYRGCFAIIGEGEQAVTVARRTRRFRTGGIRRAFRSHGRR